MSDAKGRREMNKNVKCKHEPEVIMVGGFEQFGKSTISTETLDRLISKTRKCSKCSTILTAIWKASKAGGK